MSVAHDRILALLPSLTEAELRSVREEIRVILEAVGPLQVQQKKLLLEKRARAAGWFDSGPVASGKCAYCGK